MLQSYLDIVQILLKYDTDLNIKDIKGNTPLHLAVNKNYLEIVQVLIHNGADLNIIKNNNLEIITELLQNGSDPNIKDYSGRTADKVTRNHEIADLIKSYREFDIKEPEKF